MAHIYELTLMLSGTYVTQDEWDGDYWGCGPTTTEHDCQQEAVVTVSAPSLTAAIDAAMSYDYKPETFEADGPVRVTGIKYVCSDQDDDEVSVNVEYIEERYEYYD